MYKKPVIVFEGIEGSGKTYHIKSLANFLNKKKIKYIVIREPGGSSNSEKIRNLILNKKSNFHKMTDLLLYLAARNENYIKVLKENYKKKVILIDRFTDSTLAYQHYGMGIDIKIIKSINHFLLNKISPDFTFLNVVNKKNLISRLKNRKNKNRYDNFNFKFYNRVQKGFLKLVNKKKYMIIDSNKPILYNKMMILKKIDQLIK